jgi:hypothetical protein
MHFCQHGERLFARLLDAPYQLLRQLYAHVNDDANKPVSVNSHESPNASLKNNNALRNARSLRFPAVLRLDASRVMSVTDSLIAFAYYHRQPLTQESKSRASSGYGALSLPLGLLVHRTFSSHFDLSSSQDFAQLRDEFHWTNSTNSSVETAASSDYSTA